MSKTPYLRATAALAALIFALILDSSDVGPADAQAATAPLTASPNAVVAPPPAAPRAAPAAGAPAAVAAPTPAGAAAAATAAAAPRIIVIDRAFILQRSSAGQEMLAQAQNLSKQAETQFKTAGGQPPARAGT